MTRRSDDPHRWATSDVQWVLLVVGLLALASFDVRVFYVVLVVAAVGGVLAVRRHLRRRARERENADAPFWADRLR